LKNIKITEYLDSSSSGAAGKTVWIKRFDRLGGGVSTNYSKGSNMG
jgi:hypothetical protein